MWKKLYLLENGRLRRIAAVCCAFLSIVPGAAAGEEAAGFSGRAEEYARFSALRGRLKAEHIEFEERVLLEDYGAFGTSIAVRLFTGKEENVQGRFVLALPLLSAAELSASYGDSQQPIPPFSFVQELAFAFIKKVQETGREEQTCMAVDVFFLADCWIAGGGTPGFDFAAWRDMLDSGEDAFVVYADMPDKPKTVSIYTGGIREKPPFNLVRLFAQTMQKNNIPLVFERTQNKYISQLSKFIAFEFDYDFPVLFLSPAAPSLLRKNLPDIPENILPEIFWQYMVDTAGIAAQSVYDSVQNYIVFSINGKNILIDEPYCVFIPLIFFTIVFIIIFFIYKKNNTINRRRMLFAFLAAAAGLCTIVFFTMLPASYPAADRGTFTRIPTDNVLTAKASAKPFLQRIPVSLSVESKKEVLRFHIVLENIQNSGDTPPFIYESPVPVSLADNNIIFITGDYPPLPFTLELALPAGLSGIFKIEAYWTDGTAGEVTIPVTAPR
ncbi:MAG: hypothetical protein LBG74_00765 [Spirochaetaceae bacterium]|nr:hypothetical protein [Spirochaetaceae bacterium]